MATVMLDAGHGGYDNGASFNGRREKDDTLNLTLAVGNILENKGVDVLYTRTTDVYQSPSQKARIANESDADYFISIHRNSSTSPDMYSGVQTLVYDNSGIPAVFAENINRELAKTGFKNIGVEERKNLAVLRRTKMPAALVEAGFINTEADNNIFDLKFPEVAQAIANGIIETVSGADVTGNEINGYWVEIGLFRHYDNARNLARSLQTDDIDSLIVPNVNNYYGVYHGVYDNYNKVEAASKLIFNKGYETRIVQRSI